MKIEIIQECSPCKGTGIYVGRAERDGAGIICRICKGTGEYLFIHEYEEFTKRKTRTGIKHVVQSNPGIVIGIGPNSLELSDFGGMSYSDWLAGKPFPEGSEMRKFVCPKWWYQNSGTKPSPGWQECDDNLGRRFSSCPLFINKAKCWQRFDTEQQKAPSQ